MYTKNQLMFPHQTIPQLRNLRGAEWVTLIDRVTLLPESHPESLAFVLLMVRLNGCLGCETDSYRAMRGCSACSVQTLRRYKGSDRDLLYCYAQALEEVGQYLAASGKLEALTAVSMAD